MNVEFINPFLASLVNVLSTMAQTHLIAEKPLFGYGTSDEKEVLLEAYEQEGFYHFAKKKLNAHNQYLQTGIAVGVVGMLVLMLMLFVPLYLILLSG